jgi:ERCC4-type nuclease
MIDQREPQWVQDLTFGGVPTSVTLLEFGDVWGSTDDGALIAIERKTSDDLLGSLKDGRLFTQLAGLRGLSEYAYLVICGTLVKGPDGKTITDRGVTGWNYQAVQSAILTAQELGVYVIYTSDEHFEATVAGLGKRNRGEIREKPARKFVMLDPGEQMLAALPGIGLERVDALMNVYTSPAFALCAITDTSLTQERVPGIGPLTKQNVRKVLGIPDGYDLVLADQQTILEAKGTNGNGHHN